MPVKPNSKAVAATTLRSPSRERRTLVENRPHAHPGHLWLVEGYGIATFLQLQGFGKETLMLALQSYPPLWEPLQAFASRLDGFLGEFLQGPPPAEDVGDEPAAAGQEKTSPSGSDRPAAA